MIVAFGHEGARDKPRDAWGMGLSRKKYTTEERIRIIASFVRAAAHIIETDGFGGISIRRVASDAGYNSATMYLYFKDLDELITLACVTYLKDYCHELANTADQMQTAEQTYVHTWEVFCRYAFSLPEVFHHLFFAEHSVDLNKTVDRYYRIYPNFLDSLDGVINDMLHAGELHDRNLSVLEPLAEEGLIRSCDVALINELTVAYFGKMLAQRCKQLHDKSGGPGESPEDVGTCDVEIVSELTAKFMEAVHFLLVK